MPPLIPFVYCKTNKSCPAYKRGVRCEGGICKKPNAAGTGSRSTMAIRNALPLRIPLREGFFQKKSCCPPGNRCSVCNADKKNYKTNYRKIDFRIPLIILLIFIYFYVRQS